MADHAPSLFDDDEALFTVLRDHRIHDAILLIRKGANVRAENCRGETPLHLAVVNKSHVDPLTEMIPIKGFRFQKISFYEGKSVRMATACRNEERVRELAAQGASSGVDHSLVKMLLAAGADVNSKDFNDVSPLQCAVYTGDVELVKILIDAGADLDNQNVMGATPLHDAALCGNEAIVHLLLTRGANVNAKALTPYQKETPLHWAASVNQNNSHGTVIRHLLEFGSDLNEYSKDNFIHNTPFIKILQHGDIDLVKLCIYEYHADLNDLTRDGHNPLAFALYNDDQSVRDLVMTMMKSRTINCTKNLVNSALYHASLLCRPEYVREAIARGADVNAQNGDGKTPLLAVMFDNSAELQDFLVDRPSIAEKRRQVIKLLLENGADVKRRDNNRGRKNIFELAIRSNVTEERSLAPRMIIEHTVMVEERTKKQVFDDSTMAVLNEDPDAKAHYEHCQLELRAMKNQPAKIEGTTITYFSVLMDPLEVVARYARNEDFVKAFEAGEYRSAYPTYAWWLREKFDEAAARQKMIDQASTILSSTLQFADPTALFFEKICNYLSVPDINILIDGA